MRNRKRKLIFQALAAVQAMIRASNDGPLSPAVNDLFVLAYLATQNPDMRKHSVLFWREVQQGYENAFSPETARLMRQQALSACLSGMIFDLGLPFTPEMAAALNEGVEPSASRSASAKFWASIDQMIATGVARAR